MQRFGEVFGGLEAVVGGWEGVWGVLVADEVDEG